MRFKITPKGVKSKDGRWTLEIGNDTLVVTDADGEEVADLDAIGALQRIKTPNFWESRKGYGIELRGQFVDFDGSPDMREELQALLDRGYLRKHPDAPSRAVLFGLGKAVFGVLLAGAGVAVTIVTNMEKHEGGKLWWGAMLIGIVLLCQGLYQAAGSGKWRRLAAEMEKRENRRRRPRDDRDNRDDDYEDDR
jgi:hypothetical protein